jgi:hypothetical protein
MTLTAWSDRPVEQARLLNPAFIAALIWASARGYSTVEEQGMPYPLSFISIPVVLHKSTRAKIPRTTRTSLASWIGENPEVHVRFSERATSLVPLIKEGILFGTNGRMFELSSYRMLAGRRPRSMTSFLSQSSEEVNHCMSRAEFVGKWFASSGDYLTVIALWGVAP